MFIRFGEYAATLRSLAIIQQF